MVAHGYHVPQIYRKNFWREQKLFKKQNESELLFKCEVKSVEDKSKNQNEIKWKLKPKQSGVKRK